MCIMILVLKTPLKLLCDTFFFFLLCKDCPDWGKGNVTSVMLLCSRISILYSKSCSIADDDVQYRCCYWFCFMLKLAVMSSYWQDEWMVLMHKMLTKLGWFMPRICLVVHMCEVLSFYLYGVIHCCINYSMFILGSMRDTSLN